ncbi:acyl-CoA dehydrogenase family protein [Streptomyces sp. NPDC050619]|uniref:acyl-CoA dehydrogenase family protein n=1 Tax=Streptomyces sp. NPDC050619 TaxID=3157214 RepID=UPI003424E713
MVEEASFGARVAAAADPARDARGVWEDLGAAGLIRELFAREPSAPADDARRLDSLITALDSVLPTGTTMSVGVQVGATIPLLRSIAPNHPRVARILADILGGRTMVCVATTEPDVSGSDLLATRGTVRRTDDGIVLAGTKSWVSNGLHADYAMVLLHDLPGRGLLGMSWVLVPLDASGVVRTPSTTEWFAGGGLADIRLDGVALAEDHLMSPRGRALSQMALASSNERLMMTFWARSLSRRALRGARDHLRGRASAGGVLWDNPVVRARFAALMAQWRGLDAMCAGERRAPTGPRERMALKASSARAVTSIVAGCVDLVGGEAFRDGGMGRLAAEVGMFNLLGGATGALEALLASHEAQLLKGADNDPM